MGQHQWYHFGVLGAPPVLEPILVGIGSGSLGVRALGFDPWPSDLELASASQDEATPQMDLAGQNGGPNGGRGLGWCTSVFLF